MIDAARLYGFEPNRAGFISCPFHTDKTASMKIYPGKRGFYCFGCGAAGSAIDFAMKLFNLSFRDACARLNADFNLGIDLSAPVDTDALRAYRSAQRAKKRADERRTEEYRIKCDEYRRLRNISLTKAPKTTDEPIGDEFIEALKRLPELDEWFERENAK
jgi:DNA primase